MDSFPLKPILWGGFTFEITINFLTRFFNVWVKMTNDEKINHRKYQYIILWQRYVQSLIYYKPSICYPLHTNKSAPVKITYQNLTDESVNSLKNRASLCVRGNKALTVLKEIYDITTKARNLCKANKQENNTASTTFQFLYYSKKACASKGRVTLDEYIALSFASSLGG